MWATPAKLFNRPAKLVLYESSLLLEQIPRAGPLWGGGWLLDSPPPVNQLKCLSLKNVTFGLSKCLHHFHGIFHGPHPWNKINFLKQVNQLKWEKLSLFLPSPYEEIHKGLPYQNSAL